jgi:hypothetical protein
MDRLEQLKAKYRPALETMAGQGIQVTNVELKGDKLCVEGYAPTEQAKNAAWDRIKAIDSKYADLTCDLKVGAPPEAAGGLEGASSQSLAGALASAFRSDQTPPFSSMLSNLFGNSNGQQRAGLLNQILGAAGPSLLGAALPGALGSILKGGSVTPEQAEQISPDQVKNLAEHAEKANPSIIDHVSEFYSKQPQVVQVLGAGALAMIMSHITKSSKASA